MTARRSVSAISALSDSERRHVAGLMRINHTGEVCAQALYQGQGLTARSPRVRRAMQQASDDLDFEKAAQYRDWYQQLERMLEKQQRVAAPVLQHNAALIHPHETSTDVLLVRFGQFVESMTLDHPPSDDQLDDLTRRVDEHFDPEEERPSELSRRQVDEIRLLSHWMYSKRKTLEKVPWETNVSTPAFVQAIQDVVQECQ